MRVKRGITARAKHDKLFRANKGYRMTKRRLTSVAREAYLHAGEYAYRGRKSKKRDFRALWITRISEAVKLRGLSYSSFVHKMKEAHIDLDRKTMAHLIVENPDAFDAVVQQITSVH